MFPKHLIKKKYIYGVQYRTLNYEKPTLCLSISIMVKILSRKTNESRVELSYDEPCRAIRGCTVQTTIKPLIALLSVNVIGQAGSMSMKHWAPAPDHSDYRVIFVESILPFQVFGF